MVQNFPIQLITHHLWLLAILKRLTITTEYYNILVYFMNIRTYGIIVIIVILSCTCISVMGRLSLSHSPILHTYECDRATSELYLIVITQDEYDILVIIRV